MRKIITILTITITLFFYCYSHGQGNSDSTITKRNSIFLEICGSSLFYSLNYDYLFYAKKYFKTALTLGLTYFPDEQNIFIGGITPQFNILIGRQFCAEFGFSFTKFTSNKNWDDYIALRLGLRYQKTKGGFFGRLAITPLIPTNNEDSEFFIYPWAGLSVGYTIK